MSIEPTRVDHPAVSLVSIIIPTFNAQKFIAETIDSAMAQTYPNIEIIIADDGSTDDTIYIARQKLRKECKKPWQIIDQGRNGGVSSARNRALRTASGCWVQSLDADDFLAPGKLEKQVRACIAASSEVAAVCSPWRQVWVDAGKINWAGPVRAPGIFGKPPIMNLVLECRAHHGAFLFRRSALEKIGGFDESLRIWEDMDILVRLAEHTGRFELVSSNEPLYLWRIHRDRPLMGGPEARYLLTAMAMGWIDVVQKTTGNRTVGVLGLSAQDRRLLQHDCVMFARLLYPKHREVFRAYMVKARALFPDFCPTRPWPLSIASRCLGYENAEAVAELARGLKSLIGRK